MSPRIDIDEETLERWWNEAQDKLPFEERRYTPSWLRKKEEEKALRIKEFGVIREPTWWEETRTGLKWFGKALAGPFIPREKAPEPIKLPELIIPTEWPLPPLAPKLEEPWEEISGLFESPKRVYYDEGGNVLATEKLISKWGPLAEGETKYTGPYFKVKVEMESGTRIVESLKTDWEQHWPDYLAMGAVIGGVAGIRMAGRIPEITFLKSIGKFAKTNLQALKQRFPAIVKDAKSARDLTEAAVTQHVDTVTKGMTRAQQTSVYKTFGRWLSTQKLGVMPEAITGAAAEVRPTEIVPKLLEAPAVKATGTKLVQLLQAQIPGILEQAKVAVSPEIVGPISDFIAKSVGKLTTDTAVSLINKDLPAMIEEARIGPEILPEEITPEKVPPTEIKPPIPPTPPPKELPQFGEEPIEDPIAKLNELIKKAKPLRGKLEKAYTAERAKRIAKVEAFIDETVDKVGGEEGYRMILSKLKGELVPPEAKIAFEPIKEKLTQEQLKSLYVRTWKHPYLSEWEKVSAADGLTNLLMGGIPQPKKLVLLEEIYGSELIKNILSKRAWGAKAVGYLVEAANVPRAALATADMSAFLRQGVIEIVAHPIISAEAVGKTFQFAFSPKVFEQYFVDLREDPLYPIMRKSGLSITDPSRAGMREREEAFISRFLQKIPVVKIPVEFAERSYVGFLNKIRVDIFKVWADELLDKGFTPAKDPELFKAAADVVNTFTGRGDVGRLNRVTPELNTIFFSPRLIAARFNALNPVWYAKQPKEIRKKAIGDFAKFVTAGLTTLALIKVAAGDKVSVETDPRSSDFGKIRIDNTRFDIWGGFQQWARVFTQVITGERKSTTTGEIISLNKDEYPFTTRYETVLRFIEGKLAPVPQLTRELMTGAQTFGGEDITAETIAKEKFIPMYIQDIAEAYADGGLGRAVGVGIPAFFGVGVQTWGLPPLYERVKKKYLGK